MKVALVEGEGLNKERKNVFIGRDRGSSAVGVPLVGTFRGNAVLKTK